MNFIYHPSFINEHPISTLGANHLLDSWKLIYPDSKPSHHVDFEDWTENIVRFHTALTLESDADFFIIEKEKCFNLNHEPVDIPEEGFFLGTFINQEKSCAHLIRYDQSAIADKYGATETFNKFAGRRNELCGLDIDNGKDLRNVIQEMADAGHEKLFVKVNRPKYSIEVIDIKNKEDAYSSFTRSESAWAAIHLEGKADAFLIQEFIKMRYEYRMIVVDNELASGAACIEEFTPLNNKNRFDIQLRENRDEVSYVINDEFFGNELVNQYIKVAHEFILSMSKENSNFTDYTLDLALDDKDNVIVIECNPLNNYGLYAMDYASILKEEIKRFTPENNLTM